MAKPAKDHVSPFIGQSLPRKVPSGWLFPAVASARQFYKDGRWLVPRAEFTEAIIKEALKQVKMYGISSKLSANKYAGYRLPFEHFATSVWLDMRKKS